MLELTIYFVAVLAVAAVAARFTERARRKAEQGLSPEEIARKRALEGMVDMSRRRL